MGLVERGRPKHRRKTSFIKAMVVKEARAPREDSLLYHANRTRHDL